MLIDKKITEFLEEVDSNSPAPGGGSVSALSGALGISLVRMMQHLTFGKKKFEGREEGSKQKFKDTFDKFAEIKSEVIKLIDEDTLAYNEVMKAFKMPKETEEEITTRKEAINAATMLATNTPLNIAELLYEAMKLLEGIVEVGNQNAITDLGVGALLLQAGIEGAVLNVKINLTGLPRSTAIEYGSKVNKIVDKSNRIKEQILIKVNNKL